MSSSLPPESAPTPQKREIDSQQPGVSMWLTLVLAFSVSAQDKHEAEQLFRGMEAKLEKAKSLDLSFETIWGEAALRNGQKLKGTLVAMSGNKLRLQVKGGEKNEVVQLRISDGARAILVVEGN